MDRPFEIATGLFLVAGSALILLRGVLILRVPERQGHWPLPKTWLLAAGIRARWERQLAYLNFAVSILTATIVTVIGIAMLTG